MTTELSSDLIQQQGKLASTEKLELKRNNRTFCNFERRNKPVYDFVNIYNKYITFLLMCM